MMCVDESRADNLVCAVYNPNSWRFGLAPVRNDVSNASILDEDIMFLQDINFIAIRHIGDSDMGKNRSIREK